MAALINTGTVIDQIALELGDELQERRTPSWTGALMAAAGSAIGLGVMLMSSEDALDEGERLLPLLASVALVAVAYGALAGLPTLRERIRPAAVSLLSIGLAGVALLVLPIDRGTAAARGLIMAAVFIAAWVAPLSRGRPWLLGLGLVGIWVALLDAVQNDSVGADLGLGGASVTTAGIASVLFGVALLGVMFALDKRECHGALATPFAAVGNAAFVIGVVAVLSDITSAAGVGTVVLLAGGGLAWLGAKGRHRRMTTWLGGIGVFTGLISYVGAIYDGDSLVVPGVLLALFGVMLAAAAVFIADYLELGSAATVPTPAATETDAPAAAGVEPATDGPAAGWYADPAGRHGHRWWDGTGWTDRVSDGGVEGTDPVG